MLLLFLPIIKIKFSPMNNLKVISILFLTILAISCSTVKKPVSSGTTANNNAKASNSAVFSTPKTDTIKPKSDSTRSGAKTDTPKTGLKPYHEIITSKAISKTGMFTVHKVEDKYYFEIPTSMLGKEIMAITRFVRTPTLAGYGGELVNRQMIRFEKGTEQKVFLRAQALVNVSTDTTAPIYKAVLNSNLDPIAAAFDIKAIRKDTSILIDITDYFNSDAQVIGLNSALKTLYRLGGLQSDRSYIQSIKSFPINLEIKTVKTYAVSPPPTGPTPPGAPQSVTLPGGLASGFATMELNISLILLPEVPMKKRLFDPRVGYFSTGYTLYNEEGQRTENPTFAVRWRLSRKMKQMPRDKKMENL
jgi:hypothetical protein